MAFTSFETIDPIRYANSWMRFTLGGVKSPGTIPRGGIRGFERETGWDEKAGKGTKGATLTLKGAPPCRGSITLQLFTPKDFSDWDAFVETVLSIAPDKQSSYGLSFWHPALAAVGLTTVVVKSFSPPDHQGKGLYHVVISLIEWQPPPPVSVVSTVAATASDQSGGDQNLPPPVDPQITSLEAQIGTKDKPGLLQAAQDPDNGSK